MNKHLPIAAAMFLSLALSASAGIHLALFGGYAATPGKASGEAPVFGAGLGIDLTPTLSLDLTAGRWVLSVRSTSDGLSRGRLTEIPVTLDLRARFPFGRDLAAYVSGGLGYAFHGFALDGEVAEGWRKPGFEVSERVDHGLAIQIGTGLTVPLGPAVDFDLGARYTILRTKGSWIMADLVGGQSLGGTIDKLDFDALSVVAGFRVAFR